MMENTLKDNMNTILEDILKKELKAISFLELNKDIFLNDQIQLNDKIPMPIRSMDLISGIKDNEYINNIPFERFIEGMVYVIGCDWEFKYNDFYIDVLKKTNNNIDTYIMSRALDFVKKENFINAIVFFNCLDRLSDNHVIARYNIANTLREMAVQALNRKNNEDYRLYRRISYLKFTELSKQFPHFPYSHYHLGFYYMDDKEYQKALDEWKNASELTSDESLKGEIIKMIQEAKDKRDFEEGRNEIIDENVNEGLKKIIPLVERHDGWSEAEYYTALGYRKLGNYAKAKLILKGLLDKGEDFPEIYNELGLCLFYLGDVKESIDKLENAVKLKQDEPGFLCNLGMAYYGDGDIGKAKKYINKAYDLSPDDEVTKQCKTWIDTLK